MNSPLIHFSDEKLNELERTFRTGFSGAFLLLLLSLHLGDSYTPLGSFKAALDLKRTGKIPQLYLIRSSLCQRFDFENFLKQHRPGFKRKVQDNEKPLHLELGEIPGPDSGSQEYREILEVCTELLR